MNAQSVRSLPLPAILNALGLDVAVKQRKNGEWYCKCPIHNPQRNETSFSYAPDGKFHCFSCGAKGKGAIDLVIAIRSIGYTEAVNLLSAYKPLESEKTPRTEAFGYQSEDEVPEFKGSYHKYFQPCEWLSKRVPSQEILDRYGVGFYLNPKRKSAYSGKVLIPVRKTNGSIVGYLARSIGQEDSPKYLFPKGVPKHLFVFGVHEVCRLAEQHNVHLPLKRVYLVESPFAVLKFASLGFPAVSAYGWSVSSEQSQILKAIAKGVVFLPDTDKSEEAKSTVHTLAKRLWVYQPDYPATDPEHLSEAEIRNL